MDWIFFASHSPKSIFLHACLVWWWWWSMLKFWIKTGCSSTTWSSSTTSKLTGSHVYATKIIQFFLFHKLNSTFDSTMRWEKSCSRMRSEWKNGLPMPRHWVEPGAVIRHAAPLTVTRITPTPKIRIQIMNRIRYTYVEIDVLF